MRRRPAARRRAHQGVPLGDYRLGLIVETDTVTLVRLLHRKDIYRYLFILPAAGLQ